MIVLYPGGMVFHRVVVQNFAALSSLAHLYTKNSGRGGRTNAYARSPIYASFVGVRLNVRSLPHRRIVGLGRGPRV